MQHLENTPNSSVPSGQFSLSGQAQRADESTSWAICLSGGGLRATLFELGVVLYMALAERLSNVSAFVSVSGGSILAAHLALNWVEATRNRRGFVKVASQLVAFSRRDIRNRAIAGWMWCKAPLITHFCRSLRNIHFLRKQYEVIYGKKTLEDLPSADGSPEFALVTTDPKWKHRVAFTRDRVWRINFDGTVVRETILARGTPISLAVAASSCFPPVFSRLRVTNKELRITWQEFGGTLTLTDGGVSGNLGVEVLLCLMENRAMRAKRILLCNAEPGDLREPKDNLITIANAMQSALSESAREKLSDFAPDSKECALVTRGSEQFDLRTPVVTDIAGFRTDLDKPTWDECYALIVHGAAIAHQQLGSEFGHRITPSRIRHAVRAILKQAGCKEAVPEPCNDALRGCDRRHYCCIILNLILILMTYGVVSEVFSRVLWGRLPRPYSFAIQRLCPERAVPRELDMLLGDLARAACADAKARNEKDARNYGAQIKKLKTELEGSLSRIAITVGEGSSDSVLYVVEDRQPPECERSITCKITFQGSFPRELHTVNAQLIVTGRIVSVDGKSAMAYIDLDECWAEPAQ